MQWLRLWPSTKNCSHIYSFHMKCDWQLHMLWMGIWIRHHTVTTKCAGLDLGSQLKSCVTAGRHKQCQVAVVEVPTQHGMVLTFTPTIWKVFDNLHMLWMGIWIRHHTITTTWAGLDLGSQLKSCITAWQHKWCQGAEVEALTKHGIVFTYTPIIWNVTDKLHKLWIGIWIHHHTITTTCAGLDLGSQLKSYGTSGQHKWCEGAVVEAPTQHRIVLTYALKIWKVFDKLHKLWMGIWIHHHIITTTCAGLDLESQLKSCITAGQHKQCKVRWLRLQPRMEWFSPVQA
jgi:hypothetical protein